MRQATAQLNYLQMAPRKVRSVASVVKMLSVSEAEAQLLLISRRAKEPLLKLLRSAVANAKNQNLSLEKLYVSSLRVDNGPMYKRGLPRAMGRVTPLQKKTSHITLILTEGDKIYPMRYNIVTVKKDKKEKKKVAKKVSQKSVSNKPSLDKEVREHAHKAEPGFFKRIFRRKSV